MDTVDVDFGMEREYVFSILTADISVADSILDLIDNSIDAARKHIARQPDSGANPILPESYEGYEIDLTIDQNKIEIVDNCFGIEEHLLTEKAFRLGARSNEGFSIGIYGVGLIRAFWKLANSGEMVTDTGDQAYRLRFSKHDVLKDDAPKIPASILKTSGGPRTALVFDNLTEDSVFYFSDVELIEDLKVRISQVYGLCIRKNLSITVNGDSIPEFGPMLRSDVEKLRSSLSFRTTDGVSVEIQTGVHEGYTFDGEDNYSRQNNTTLTSEFGWYVVCNDRIVLLADRTRKVGWTETWHSEYNGFLGWVFFKSDDAEKLPWDTTKTDISLEKIAQRETAPKLKEKAKQYRTVNRNTRYSDLFGAQTDSMPSDSGNPLIVKTGSPKSEKGAQPKTTKQARAKKGPVKKKDHSKDLEQLLPALHVATDNQRVIDLVDEGAKITINEFPYSSAMLLRNIVESITNDYLERSGGMKRCLEAHWQEANKRRASQKPPKPAMTKSQQQDNRPTFRETMSWLAKNGDEFPDETRKANLRHLQSTMGVWPKLNEITHERGTISDIGNIKTYRNTVLPLIEFLLSEVAITGD